MDILSSEDEELRLYNYARISSWLAVITVITSSIGVGLGIIGISFDIFSILVQNPPGGFFGSSLSLILNVISIVFLLVIFLVQNANQNYSNRLSRVIFRDRYFLGAVLFIIVALLFNVSGIYFNWQAPLTAIGFAFSLSSIVIIISLISLAAYFIDISNIVHYLSIKYRKDISADKIYQPAWFGVQPQNKEYISKLAEDVQLITSTCIRAIQENHHTLVNTCLNSLYSITDLYLKETNADDVSDDFLQNLNDEFQFIGSTAFDEYSRQKYAEDVVETVGNIGINITMRRELKTPGDIWGALLRRLFNDAVEYDRNKVAPIAIQKTRRNEYWRYSKVGL
jgi:hypothetical protein